VKEQVADPSHTDMEAETHSRSLAKALSWRVFALAITTGVSFVLSESIAVAVSIGVVDSAIKIGAYYLHERAWLNIRFGRKREVDSKLAS
jgi:adenylylsulfate kinase